MKERGKDFVVAAMAYKSKGKTAAVAVGTGLAKGAWS
jgi:hypothetical protein